MTAAEQQTFEMERMETMRTFDVTLINPSNGRMTVQRVFAHFHTTDDEGNLSIATIQTDGTRNVRHLFNANRWVQLDEFGTSALHASKLVLQ